MDSRLLNGLFAILSVVCFLLIMVVIFVAAAWPGENKEPREQTEPKVNTMCLDGVEYYVTHNSTSMNGYLAVRYNRDGEVVLCGDGD